VFPDLSGRGLVLFFLGRSEITPPQNPELRGLKPVFQPADAALKGRSSTIPALSQFPLFYNSRSSTIPALSQFPLLQ
jgi:hypothetical protein